MDPLSDALRTVRLKGGIFLQANFSAPWCVRSHLTREDMAMFLGAPGQLIAYHVVLEGAIRVAAEGEAAVDVGAGEVVLLPRNDPHTLASADGLAPVEARGLIQPALDDGLLRIVHGGGGTSARVICGFLGAEDEFNPLIAALPKVLKLDLKGVAARDWVESSVRFALRELVAGTLATAGAVPRLSELLFVEAVRHYAQSQPDTEAGWMRGLADPQIGRALGLIHARMEAPWSVDSLAKEVAMSRSAFVERFGSIVGMPPIRYLATWRLQQARLILGETTHPIARVAHKVGYESEEAFSRAFKREFGVSPAHWRESRAARHAPAS